MDDKRVWAFEASLWLGSAEDYREKVDRECVMVLPAEPFVTSGTAAIEAVTRTPRWTEATLTERIVSRPAEGLIVLAYRVEAQRDQEAFSAYCTSTYRRISHEHWRVVQHHQTHTPASRDEGRASALEQAQEEAAEDRKKGGYQ